MRRIREGRGVDLQLDRLPLDDQPTYALLQRADTVGVFQLESGGIRRMLTDLKPSCFADVVAALALYRPGPLDAKLDDGSTMVEVFIRRKHGRETIRYPHPALETVLRETYGVIVYQEQVMQIAQALAGYSLGDADNLRRAMGKKKAEEMAKERARFVAGAARLGTADEKLAREIFDQMETFAAYGFNKSHSAAYAVITYQTAFLKAHYPVEFMAGLLSLEAGDSDATYKNIAECRVARDPHPAAGREREPRGLHRRRQHDPFRPGCREGRRVQGDRGDHRRPGRGLVHESARLLSASAWSGGEPARDREPARVRRLRFARAQPRPAVGGDRRRHALGGAAGGGEDEPADGPLRRLGRGRRAAATTPGCRDLAPRGRARPRARGDRLSSSPVIRWTATSRT